LFSLDASSFPKLKANFYAFSKDGYQMINLSIPDFRITENEIERKITFISCPTPKPPKPISAVLTLDVSGSMLNGGLDKAKEAAVAWVNAMPGNSECAITSFDTRNTLHQDFTNDKQKLKDAIYSMRAGGGTNFDAGFINPVAGALLIAENGKNKRVVVFLTDGQSNGTEQNIIDKANQINATVYCVTLGSPCPEILRNVAEKTGGMYFENITTEEEAKAVYMKILSIAQSLEPCTIEWESADECNAYRKVSLHLVTTNTYAENSYISPAERIPKIEFDPSPSLRFGNVEPPMNETQELTIIARNKNIWINGINISQPEFQISDWGGSAPPFILLKDSKRKIKIKYTPQKDGYIFCKFDLDNSACFGKTFFATAGIFNPQTEIGTLKLTFPDGGETFLAGEDSIITWEGILPVDTVSLDYSTDKGESWNNITNKASNYKFNWNNIPNTPSNECLMKVTKGEEFDLKAGNLIKVLGFSHSGQIAMSPISNEIAVLHSIFISIIDINTKKISRSYSYDFSSNMISLDYNPQGDRIAIGGINVLKIVDAKTGEIVNSFNIGKRSFTKIKFSPDGNYLACVDDHYISVIDVKTGATVGNVGGYIFGNIDILYSPNGEFLISSGDKLIKLWDANSFQLRDTISLSDYGGHPLAISPDCKKLACGIGDYIKLWNLNTLEEITSFSTPFTMGNNIDFSPNGEMLAAYSRDKTIKLWDVKTGFLINTFSGISNADGKVLFSHNGKKLIGSGGLEIKVWDIHSGKALDSLKGHTNTINKVSISPDQKMIASAGDDGNIILWDFNSGWKIKSIDGKSKWLQAAIFTNDNKSIICSSNGDTIIRVFDVATGNEIKTFTGHTAAVSSIKLNAKGDKLVSGGFDNSIKIWDFKTGAILHDIWGFNSGITSVDFSPDGTKIASGTNDNRIIIWDANTGKEITTFSGHGEKVNSVAFSPDGTKLASGSDDRLVKVWEMATGKCIFTSKFGHTKDVKSVAFTPDGDNVISGSADGKLMLWDLQTSIASRTFTGTVGSIFSVAVSADGFRVFGAGEGRTIGVWAVYDLTESNIQQDESDSLWSIVAPDILSHDVDMGKVFVSSMKDSLVDDFIKNSGTWKFHVDTVFIRGADSSAFSVVAGNGNYDVEPSDKQYAIFRFNPKEARDYISDIVIVSQGGDTLLQKIKGTGVEQTLRITPDIIDFGKVYLNHYKDTTVTAVVENVGSKMISITNVANAGPDKKQFSIIKGGGSFSLNPGEKHDMELQFLAKELGRTSGSLAFEHADFGSPAIAQLFAHAYKIVPFITSNSPICVGHDLLIYADSIPNVKYHWSGPNGFISNERNIIIKKAGTEHAGLYQLFTTINDPTIRPAGDISSDTAFILVEINIDKVSPGDSSLIFVGNGERVENYIKLTESKPWDAGSVWLKNRFSVKQDFSTTFEFEFKYGDNRREPEQSIPGADGFAFVFQNHSYPALGFKGESMGYNGITNSLAIEFDLFRNIYDPNGNHISVQSQGAYPNTADHRIFNSVLGMNTKIPTVNQDVRYFVKVSYKNSTNELSIYLDTTDTYGNPVLIVDDLNLSKKLNLENDEYVYIGFTAATGQACQEHRIYNWEVPCDNQYVGVEDGRRQTTDGRQENVLYIYPNPANDILNIEYSINANSNVSLEIYDILGNKIKSTEYGYVEAGKHNVIMSFSKDDDEDTKNLLSGMYYLVLRAGDVFMSGKFGIVR